MFNKKSFLFLALITLSICLGVYRIMDSGISTDTPQRKLLNDKPDWVYPASNRILYCLKYGESDVLVQTTDEVLAIDADTGAIVWVNHLPKYDAVDGLSATRTGMQVEGDILISHRGDGTIQAIQIKSGEIIWQDLSGIGETIKSIYVNKETVFVATLSDRLVAYNLYTGEVRWQISVPDRTQLYIFSYGDFLLLGTSYDIRLIDPDSGVLMSTKQLDGLVTDMMPDSTELYLAYYDNRHSFISLDLSSFQPLWQVDKKDVSPLTTISTSILIDNNIVYFVGDIIVAFEKSTGELLWRGDYNDQFGKPVIIDKFLFAQGRQKLYVIDKYNGENIQVLNLQGGILPMEWIMYEKVNLCANNNTVWVARGVNLYAYNLNK